MISYVWSDLLNSPYNLFCAVITSNIANGCDNSCRAFEGFRLRFETGHIIWSINYEVLNKEFSLIYFVVSYCGLIYWFNVPNSHLLVVVICVSWSSHYLELQIQIFNDLHLLHILWVLILLGQSLIIRVLNE